MSRRRRIRLSPTLQILGVRLAGMAGKAGSMAALTKSWSGKSGRELSSGICIVLRCIVYAYIPRVPPAMAKDKISVRSQEQLGVVSAAGYRQLAEFRYRIRQFLHFSEEARASRRASNRSSTNCCCHKRIA